MSHDHEDDRAASDAGRAATGEAPADTPRAPEGTAGRALAAQEAETLVKPSAHADASGPHAPDAREASGGHDAALAHDHAAACCCGQSHSQGNEAFDCLPDEELLYDLADLFKVFADTTRIKILYALMGEEMRVADIAQAVGATQSAVSHQLRTLKQVHLVKFKRDGKNVLYSLSDDHVHTVLAQGMNHICE